MIGQACFRPRTPVPAYGRPVSDLRIALVITTLAALAVVSGLHGRRHRVGSVLLALTSVVWLLVDSPFEGAVLFDVTSHNGLTFTDLFGLAGLAVAAGQFRLHWTR